MGHFLPCKESMSASELANLFLRNIWKLHGTPKITTLDWGSIFTSGFLKALYEKLQIEPRFSTAYHLEMDSQTERVNQWLEGYLRTFRGAKQDNWVSWLPLAEFIYNNHVNCSTGKAPFKVIYRRTLEWGVGEVISNTIGAEEWGEGIRKIQDEAKAALQQAWKEGNKLNKFSVGERVMLLAMNISTNWPSKKLDDKKLRLFPVTEVISSHTYQLDLPASMKIHLVFHVNLLSAFQEEPRFDQPKPRPRVFIMESGEEEQEVEEILDWWADDEGQLRYRVRWVGENKEGDSWERAEKMAELHGIMKKFLRKFPEAPTPANWTKRPTKRKEKAQVSTLHSPSPTSATSATLTPTPDIPLVHLPSTNEHNGQDHKEP
ncbi:Transposon Ty3-G Gag-Pol polyprotein [Ceratobasidium theobromae]|uniref:Transposon Ty3-G Gag-Pol polyprotein n=1 Tax=Ceratobasidium theobromae TaxID=1582974 RepID=A0A5N5Q7S5_9AGAM|nr:Transposon Ty3-G Gag-Pol polyprotein [Ceratobasidium theobromae]